MKNTIFFENKSSVSFISISLFSIVLLIINSEGLVTNSWNQSLILELATNAILVTNLVTNSNGDSGISN